MTRNEEKRAVSFDKYAWSPAYRHAFEEGVEWADKTLTKKAWEWIERSVLSIDNSGGYDTENIRNRFYEAMEG